MIITVATTKQRSILTGWFICLSILYSVQPNLHKPFRLQTKPPGWQVALLEPNYKAPALDNIKPLQGKTMITIEKETRDVLRKLARKGQTYDNLIREMIVKCYSSTTTK